MKRATTPLLSLIQARQAFESRAFVQIKSSRGGQKGEVKR